jgi:septal ring factor EnvC (AmiA/AmiB activator)
MKFPVRMATRALVVAVASVAFVALGAAPSRAGVWDDLRARVGSLLGQSGSKREQALQARSKAQAIDRKADAARSRLVAAQKALLEANAGYMGILRQTKRTEAELVRQRHRRFLVTERYNRRRILFGRRLAAMQRTGSSSYLQIFLGSRTLSDLSRRAYLFRALIERDAGLQRELSEDKAELDGLNNALSAQWSRRSRLKKAAYKEQRRVARAASEQRAELQKLAASRDALQAFAASRVEEAKALNQAVYDHNARAQAIAIAAARENEREAEEAARREEEAEEARRQTRSLRSRDRAARSSYRFARRSTRDDGDDDSGSYRSSYRSSYSTSSTSTRRRSSNRYADRDIAERDEIEYESPRSSRRSYSSSGYRSRRYGSYRSRRYRSYGSYGSTRYTRRDRPRTVQVRVAERVSRTRYVPTLGGALKPMSIPEIVFKEKSVPISSGGGASSGGSGSSSSGGSSSSSGDDFPASDP